MKHWQLITASVKRNGNPFYPSHVRLNAAYKMLQRAAWHLRYSDTAAAHVLASIAKEL